MLDFMTYRTSEMLAKCRISSWRIAQPHNLDHFQSAGFPIRVTSFGELGQLVDTMQENRFASYMDELGGFTDAELKLFLDACCDAVNFQLIYFPQKAPIVPLSTLISMFVLYIKLRKYDADFEHVLEIGPGCGYLSFFLKHHPALKSYVQIEAAESFYVFQSMVNIHCFGSGFVDHAFAAPEAPLERAFSTAATEMEVTPGLSDFPRRTVCHHYPWWRLGDVHDLADRFDIITSNANLREFSIDALSDYLTIIHRCLRPSGLFLVQCTGREANGSLEQLFERIRGRAFAPLMFVDTGRPVTFGSGDTGSGLLSRIVAAGRTAVPPQTFARQNLAYVKKGHPLFDKYLSTPNMCRGDQCNDFVAPESVVQSVFFERPSGRRKYSMVEITEMTIARMSQEAVATRKTA